ncbi:NAD(P)-dependent glycerol-3-phosphate dehydrogenase [bacterium]|nr:NAD(P)-dependent glycerol-3-phosphate dehydrogenase [bacterium]
MTRIFISGAGAFGTALALVFHKAGKDVTLISRNSTELVKNRTTDYLPGVSLPKSLKISNSTTSLSGGDVLILAIPMQNLTKYLENLHQKPKVAIACCKGIDLNTKAGPTEVIRNTIGGSSAILTGPSFASDIAMGLPTGLTIATENKQIGTELQKTLSTDSIRLYLSSDPIGAELGGALKNVIAIACGLCIGAGFGDSARSALLTRGFAEIVKLATTLGAKQETLYGLSGIGDLVLTCTSPQSRNFSYGFSIGANLGTKVSSTVEGIATARAVLKLSIKYNIDMPITKGVVDIIDGSKSVSVVLSNLLERPLTKE